MDGKIKLALVSITVNAVGPMTDYLNKNCPEFKVTNYLDGYLMEKIRADGGINDESMGRMLQMLTNACRDGNEAVIITCTVFTKYQEMFNSLFSAPIISADSAMLHTAASAEGRKAIIYSFPGTYNATLGGYQAACRALGADETVDMVLAEGAFEAAQNGNLPESDRLVREKLRELDGRYDTIALAQISLVGAMNGLEMRHAKICSSPSCAAAAVHERLGR